MVTSSWGGSYAASSIEPIPVNGYNAHGPAGGLGAGTGGFGGYGDVNAASSASGEYHHHEQLHGGGAGHGFMAGGQQTLEAATDNGSNGQAIISEPTSSDILFGRGRGNYEHPGNCTFRSIIQQYAVAYNRADRAERARYCDLVFSTVYSLHPPGRFLVQKAGTKLWEEAGKAQATRKIQASFRDAPKPNTTDVSHVQPSGRKVSESSVDESLSSGGGGGGSVTSAVSSTTSTPKVANKLLPRPNRLGTDSKDTSVGTITSMMSLCTVGTFDHSTSGDISLSNTNSSMHWSSDFTRGSSGSSLNTRGLQLVHELEGLVEAETAAIEEAAGIDVDGGIVANPNDVLCARGRGAQKHPGTIFYRTLVDKYAMAYRNSLPEDKTKFCRLIMDIISQKQPVGRFLERKSMASDDQSWVEVDEKVVIVKVQQALRDRGRQLSTVGEDEEEKGLTPCAVGDCFDDDVDQIHYDPNDGFGDTNQAQGRVQQQHSPKQHSRPNLLGSNSPPRRAVSPLPMSMPIPVMARDPSAMSGLTDASFTWSSIGRMSHRFSVASLDLANFEDNLDQGGFDDHTSPEEPIRSLFRQANSLELKKFSDRTISSDLSRNKLGSERTMSDFSISFGTMKLKPDRGLSEHERSLLE